MLLMMLDRLGFTILLIFIVILGPYYLKNYLLQQLGEQWCLLFGFKTSSHSHSAPNLLLILSCRRFTFSSIWKLPIIITFLQIMSSRPVPALVKDSLTGNQDVRMMYLSGCKKIFLHRDYTNGLGVKFETAYPEALRGMVCILLLA